MTFRASFCDPFNPKIKEIGDIEKDQVIPLFDSIKWKDFIDRMESANENEIHYSPSLEVENKENKNGLSVSIIDHTEWYIFFKRPKMITKKKLFSSKEVMEENYLTEVAGQTIANVRECIEALLRNDLEFLEKKVQ